MDDDIRIERLPDYSHTVRENGRADEDRKQQKDPDKPKKKKNDDLEDGHIDTVA